MTGLATDDLLGPELSGALRERGFTQLTAVQEAVLDPSLAGRDLRVTSQTGSGKTVAIGFVLRDVVKGPAPAVSGAARPRALVVTPTRELAHQVEQELSWLYASLGVKVVTTTGGASGRDERRALATGPAVVVGTPGRLLDHLSRHSIDASEVAAVVLDEADRMLDLGFREDLTAILGYAPEGHRTHLMSATFPEDVRALADRVQTDPAHVEGTRLGAANADIVHHIILVDAREKLGAVINILLASPDEQALVFARTRADVASLARHLAAARFDVGSLSGEMDQTARNRAMAAFKKGTLRVMVATDVAARGIDVQNVAHVIHADPPGDADTYTHRSGRTGRAGRKGRSSVLVTPSALRGVSYLLRRAGVAFVVEPAPSAESIRAAADERLFATLTGDAEEEIPERTAALAGRLAATGDVPRVLARLLQRVRDREASEPVELRRIEPPVERPRAPPSRPSRPADAGAPRQGRGELPRAPTHGYPLPRPRRDAEGAPDAAPRQRLRDDGREWARFRVTWGSDKGADPRRLLAVICRRGGIRGSDVGAIRIGERWSTVEVDARVARAFSDAAGAPDPREPGVVIRPDGPSSRDHERPPRPPVRPAAESPPRRPPPRTGNGPRAREPHYKGARSRPAMDTREPPKRHR